MLINDALYVHGGKSDEYNQYSYSSAPTDSDLLYLDLSSSFNVDDPPWQLLSSDGPQVAWHTLSALNFSMGLTFGGQPGWTSEPWLVTRRDSAWLLDVYNRTQPSWIEEAEGWADEPMRRMRHTAVTSKAGKVYIIGGERADGSGNTFDDNYVFDPSGPSFSALPTEHAPSHIYGHGSVILPNQHILVFGGYSSSSSSLVSFGTIWILDVSQDPPVWSTSSVSGSTFPDGRIAFAYVLLDGPRILIHGGSDQSGQTTLSDGWILDVSQDSWTWTQVNSLTQLGPRRDHFAASVGSGVIFGFGYGNSGPVDESPVQIYDPDSGNMGSTYSPPSSSYTETASQTIPAPTQTGSNGGSDGGATGTGGGTGTNTGVHPTSTVGNGDGQGGSDNGNGTGGGGGSGSGDGSGDGDDDDGDLPGGGDKKRTTAIAVGTILGFLLCAAIIIVVVWVWRHRRQSAQFSRIDDDEDMASQSPATQRSIPIAGGYDEKTRGSPRQRGGRAGGVLSSLGLAGIVGVVQRVNSPRRERRDMLADEDTRDFNEWYRNAYGTGESSWSLRTLFGNRMRREASGISSISSFTAHGEKYDPFSDGASLLHDEETGYMGAAAPGVASAVAAAGLRPPHSRHTTDSRPPHSRHTTGSRESIYVDPFGDPMATYEDVATDEHIVDDATKSIPPRLLPPPGALYTNLPMVFHAHTLSPLSETTSRNTMSLEQSSSSHEQGVAPYDTASSRLSSSSYSHLGSPRATSIINANPPAQPLRRSETWWARFARTPLLDRRGSVTSRRGTLDLEEFRDPNPPPRLVAIEESQHSGSPPEESPNSRRAASKGSKGSKRSATGARRVYGVHGRSASSLHTQRTVDSAAIEQMGLMDVAQRVRTGSHRTRDSSASYSTMGGASLAEDGRWLAEGGEHDAEVISSPTMIMSPTMVTSPVAMAAAVRSPSPISLPPSVMTNSGSGSGDSTSLPPPPVQSKPSAGVLSRVRDYERRLSHGAEPPPPTNTRAREERTKPPAVDYGLVPRQPLFVANPDREKKGSADS